MPPFPSLPSPPALFPTYLVPSLPFRSRQSSTDSTASSQRQGSFSSAPSTSNDPASTFLGGHSSHLRCARCASDLALSTQIISKGFTGRHGRAYLVAPSASSSSSSSAAAAAAAIDSTAPTGWRAARARADALPNLPNTHTHKPVPRQLVTGAHTVGDISCAQCGSVLGWKYVSAEEEGQRYKVGKFILETKRVCRSSTWEEEEEEEEAEGKGRAVLRGEMRGGAHDPVEFDSQDEDECEDLFMGVWTPQLATKRRRQRRFAKGDDTD